MRKNPVIITGLIIILLIAGAVLVWQKKLPMDTTPSVTPTPTPPTPPITPTPVPSPNVDTSTWKTYRNEEYGFEVKYPEGWEVRSLTDLDAFIIVSKDPNNYSGLTIAVQGEFPRGIEGEIEGAEYKSQKEKLTFERVIAIKYTSLVSGKPLYIFVSNFEGIKNKKWGEDAKIWFDGITSPAPNLQKVIEMDNQLLSTLRFLD